ncbi:unnamed protein product [Effrenium voratum]|uniref:Pseudouridine synthase RsuA/RluA-like domain-containing protein n=1 Tax=Effrenium voratum TaxID=2562239 RepID=A0AA36NA81_9DINO|nr:unnamed protein product [Effrenium voratum]
MQRKPSFVAHENRWRDAVHSSQRLRDAGMQPDVFGETTSMRSFTRRLQWQHSLASLDTMRLGLKIDIVCCGTFLGCCKRQWRNSLHMLQWAGRQHLQLNTPVFGHATEACKQASLWRRASYILEAMKSKSIVPDSQSSTRAMAACDQKWQVSLTMMSNMAVLSLEVDQVTCNSALSSCARVAAWATTVSMMRFGTDQATLSTCRGACAKVAKWELPLELLDASLGLRVCPDVIDFGVTLSACEKAGHWQRSLDLIGSISKDALQPDRASFHSCMGSASWTVSLQELAVMASVLTPTVTSYNIAISTCREHWERGFSLLRTWRQGIEPDAISYNSAMAQVANWQLLMAMHCEMQEGGGAPEEATWLALAGGFRKQRRWQKALVLGRQLGLQPASVMYHAAVTSSPWAAATALSDRLCVIGSSFNLAQLSESVGPWRRALARDIAKADQLEALTSDVGAWRTAVALFASSFWQRLPPASVLPALRAASQAPWPVALAMCSPFLVEQKAYGILCDLSREGSRWQEAWQALQDFHSRSGRVDALHCSSVMRACSQWPEAVALLKSSAVVSTQLDGIAWNSLLATSSAATSWSLATSLGLCMASFGLQKDVVTCNTLLGACQHWDRALTVVFQMHETRVPVEDVACLTAIDACAQAGQVAAGERIFERFAPDMSAPVRLWSLAQLSVLTNVSAYFKDAYIYLMTKAAKPSELSKLWWASSTLGLQNVAFSRRVEQLSSSALSKFQLEELLAVSMGACTSDASTDFLLSLSEELQSRLQTLSPSSEAKTRRVLQDIMGVLWAINFAAALSPKLLRSAEQATKRLATFLDSVSQPSTVSIPSMGTDGPELCLDLADRMVITKPPGWEVYGQSQLQLLSFIQAVIGARPIHQNLEDACGFVHRLDIPSSGLILSAKTHAAYYDLQLQLVSGSILRDYLVLCHGCVSFQRHKVSARLSLIQNTTRAGGQGRASRTLLKLMSYLSHGSDSFSLLLARILTGRRHQIRSHFAFLGHPSLCDSRTLRERTTTWR